MRNNYNEKIAKINSDRVTMLNIVRENIANGNVSLSTSLDTTINVLNFDDINAREYTSIVKAKELIIELTEQISKATTIEEVINLRKKVNYYINKIKQEMIKRNIDQESFEKMYSDVVYLRNRISVYLRFLKREDKVREIDSLSTSIDDLDDIDRIKLKKIISTEVKYNKRVLKNMNENVTDNNIQKIVKRESLKFFPNNELEDVPYRSILDDHELTQLISEVSEYLEDIPEISEPKKGTLSLSGEKYLTERIKYYNTLYKFYDLLQYNGNFIQNVINLFRNIPRYRKNKKVIRAAKKDYNVFYHGQDLGSFIDYSKKRNSIVTALAAIFKNSSLSKKEIECLYNHEKCKEWIMNFHNLHDYWDKDDTIMARVK